ncbi:hypothetical protein [Streptomyces poonensis]|uniref:Secreted protein n=1 Tax=Streptomyces poonensis TaxID=68255 RepID=A0A918Q7E9_9ACTN|nr:hypothetical protein [Streptomyces poonensis]GGZ34421.1 hypothetical protein GCM10010365_64200 [Streptomyces poonensis]GLJ89302.1 hypothetical protein GCM10017589_19020 [Streptomyces poonensis]
MRPSRSLAPVSAAAALPLLLLMTLPCAAVPHARAGHGEWHARVVDGPPQARLVEGPPYARVVDGPRVRPKPFGAECRTAVDGSRAVAYCHNPHADADRVRLHVECERWWDIDTDGPPAEAGPARTVRLTGRCWQEVRSVWVSHERQRQRQR